MGGRDRKEKKAERDIMEGDPKGYVHEYSVGREGNRRKTKGTCDNSLRKFLAAVAMNRNKIHRRGSRFGVCLVEI